MADWLKRTLIFLLTIVWASAMTFPASAQVTLDDVLKRVEALEKENISLKEEVMALKAASTHPQQVAAAPVVAPAPATNGNFLKTKLDVTLYGQIKADFVATSGQSADTGSLNTITLKNAIARRNGTEDHGEFNASAQDSRIGFILNPVSLDNGGKVSGKMEIDFTGELAAAKYNPRMRLGYLTLAYDNWSLMGGQNWDFFAPLNSSLANTSNLNRGGNLGNRHPEAYLENRYAVLGGKLKTQLGFIDGDALAQEDSGAPIGAAYVEYARDIFGIPATFGVGGVYGSTRGLTGAAVTSSTDPKVWGVTYNSTLQFTKWLSLKGEGYRGGDLSVFESGDTTNAGIYTYANSVKSVVSQGGFVELTLKPTARIENNYGWGIDGMKDDNINGLSTAANQLSGWDVNRNYYTNVKYSLSKDMLVALEYQRLFTHYFDGAQGADNRVQTTLIYKF